MTELCLYRFIKESVRFPAGSGRLLFTAAEQQPENGTAQRLSLIHISVFVPAVFSLYFDLFDGLIQTYVFVFLTSLFMKESIGGEE